jgi:DNA-binding winged helix-turn-helix (wHTH) protein
MVSEDPAAYEFADFYLDPAHRQLLRSGEPVPLTPKVFDTLLYLVEHRHAALEKDELLKALWPDVVVEENNLGQAISKLRAALGEAPGANRYIATIPGRGYRFVAPVTPIFGPDARPLAREEAPDSAPRLWQVSRLT